MDFQTTKVSQVFNNCPPQIKVSLLTIRQWIYEVADNSDEIGQVEECLKWGEPSYVTDSPKSGTTIRLSKLKSSEHEYGLFVHCQTTLIEEFRVAYPDLRYDKNRGILFDSREPIQTDVIKQFIYLAMTYHTRKSSCN